LSLISLLTFRAIFNYATRSSSLSRTTCDIWRIWNVCSLMYHERTDTCGREWKYFCEQS